MSSSQMFVAKRIMAKEVVTVRPGAPLRDAIQVMAARNIGCLVVMDKTSPVGILTERDIVRKIGDRNIAATSVQEVMTQPLVTVAPEAPIEELFRKMRLRGIRRLPVVAEGRLAGIVTERDLMNAVPILLAGKEAENSEWRRELERNLDEALKNVLRKHLIPETLEGVKAEVRKQVSQIYEDSLQRLLAASERKKEVPKVHAQAEPAVA